MRTKKKRRKMTKRGRRKEKQHGRSSGVLDNALGRTPHARLQALQVCSEEEVRVASDRGDEEEIAGVDEGWNWEGLWGIGDVEWEEEV
jgi:hypothetical protein